MYYENTYNNSKGEDWKDSKYRTREWERRVDIAVWEHNYEKNEYYITINIKGKK